MRGLLAGLVLMLAVPAMSVAAGPKVYDKPILSLLGHIEGPDGYDELSGFIRHTPPKPISQLTIREVLEFQRKVRKAGAKSSAVGKYQFIYETLNRLVARHRIDPGQKLDARTQDFLARMLLNDCNYYDATADTTEIGNCVATVWAAFPVLTGKRAGKSYYHGIAGNRALTTVSIMRAIIGNRMVPPVDLRRQSVISAGPVVWPEDGKFADKVPLR
ncbi:hypothetical protein ACEUZ9_000495 [Paracoccus litorisediminis]|uniref:hypothetical protein n=1 Tax=Paracoccus litorisediminis TaxID=2006130 RepID=UPI003732E9C9